ncbi:MFS transporter [Flavobacterium sp.]|uniref:MFS transporter n=1 Tax=Flavobacterium sp. TaxID=239 RepID=UPI00286CBD1F|nr:MFS transporter [Flavobacterium sp.]
MPILPKGHPKLLNAWAFYDWANSVYSLVIASAVFPIFYNKLFENRHNLYIEFFGYNFKNSALISFVTAAAFLCVAVFSPLLSGIADYMGNKKIFMRIFNYIGALSCIGLYMFDLNNIGLGLTFYFFGLIGFWGSLVFYNSYLPDIAFPEQQDKVSAKGYSLGYIGSVLLLIINLAMIMKPTFFNISGTPGEASMKAMRYSFMTVGVWWIVFSKYTYFYLPKGNSNKEKVNFLVIFNGFRELKKVWKILQSEIPLKRYLLSFFVFSMAVQTVMLIATYFGAQEIQWKDAEQSQIGLITCILLIQLIAILGAFLTSRASAKFGNINVLIFLNAFWLLLCGFAYFITTPNDFYIMASLVGLVMGGIQSLGRSTYSKFLPKTEDTTSFFSFYDVAEKVGIVIGMMVYGLIDQITGSPRFAIVFLGVFFLAGLLLLLRIPKKVLS